MVMATGRCERAVVELCVAWQIAGRAKFRLDCLVASAFFRWKRSGRSDGKSAINGRSWTCRCFRAAANSAGYGRAFTDWLVSMTCVDPVERGSATGQRLETHFFWQFRCLVTMLSFGNGDSEDLVARADMCTGSADSWDLTL